MAMKHFEFSQEEQQILEKMPVPFVVYYVEHHTGVVVAVSDGVCKLFQVERVVLMDHLNARKVDFIHPEDRLMVQQALSYAYEHPGREYKLAYRLKMPFSEDYIWECIINCVSKTPAV